MSLPKSISISIIVILLLVNILLGLLVIKMSNASNMNYDYELKAYVMQQASLHSSTLKNEFNIIGVDNAVLAGVNYGFFIPPDPCGACITTQLDIIVAKAASDPKCSIVVVTPSARKQDTLASCSDCDNIKVVEYNEQSINNPRISYNQGGILFSIAGESIVDVFVTNALNPQLSELYLSI